MKQFHIWIHGNVCVNVGGAQWKSNHNHILMSLIRSKMKNDELTIYFIVGVYVTTKHVLECIHSPLQQSNAKNIILNFCRKHALRRWLR